MTISFRAMLTCSTHSKRTPNNIVTKQAYDRYGRLVKSLDGLQKLTLFAYSDTIAGSQNPKGLLETITDANNNVTRYSYDPLRRLITAAFPEGTNETYTYRPDNLLLTKTDRLTPGQTITYGYDDFKRLTQKTYPNSASIIYSYTGQLLTTITDNYAGETHTFSYNSATEHSYRMTSNTQGARGTINYIYGVADRVSHSSINGGPYTDYTYYSDGVSRRYSGRSLHSHSRIRIS